MSKNKKVEKKEPEHICYICGQAIDRSEEEWD